MHGRGGVLNHVELVYRPGERALAAATLELLGLRVVDRGGEFFTALIDPGGADSVNNVLYASEVTPEQWELEGALAGEGVAGPASAYRTRMHDEPQRSVHFGIRLQERADLDAVIERIRSVDATSPLCGRIAVSGVYAPGDPGSLTDTMVQAFVWTDVFASGLLLFGQHIELQHHLA